MGHKCLPRDHCIESSTINVAAPAPGQHCLTIAYTQSRPLNDGQDREQTTIMKISRQLYL